MPEVPALAKPLLVGAGALFAAAALWRLGRRRVARHGRSRSAGRRELRQALKASRREGISESEALRELSRRALEEHDAVALAARWAWRALQLAPEDTVAFRTWLTAQRRLRRFRGLERRLWSLASRQGANSPAAREGSLPALIELYSGALRRSARAEVLAALIASPENARRSEGVSLDDRE